MRIDLKKYQNKFIVALLIGLLLLVVVTPVKEADKTGTENNSNTEDTVAYYEEKLDSMLEASYGYGSIEVMLHMNKNEKTDLFGDSDEAEEKVDGVLIVTTINNENAVAEMTYAVSSLYNLPTHRIAVLTKKGNVEKSKSNSNSN